MSVSGNVAIIKFLFYFSDFVVCFTISQQRCLSVSSKYLYIIYGITIVSISGSGIASIPENFHHVLFPRRICSPWPRHSLEVCLGYLLCSESLHARVPGRGGERRGGGLPSRPAVWAWIGGPVPGVRLRRFGPCRSTPCTQHRKQSWRDRRMSQGKRSLLLSLHHSHEA